MAEPANAQNRLARETSPYLLLFAMWSLAACAVLLLVPPIAAHFDRRS